jgi:MFS family permease
VAAFLCGVTTSSFFTLGPILAQRRGLDTGGVALFMACGTLDGFLSAWPLGKLSDRVDRRLAIIGAAVTAAATLFMLMMVPKEAPEWVLYLYVAIFGGTIIPTYSVVMAHVNDTVGKGDFVAASGGLLIVQGAGAVAGPIIAGSAMSLFQRGEAYTLITAQALIAAFGVYRLTRRAAPPAMHKGTFVVEPPVPVATTLESSDSRGSLRSGTGL